MLNSAEDQIKCSDAAGGCLQRHDDHAYLEHYFMNRRGVVLSFGFLFFPLCDGFGVFLVFFCYRVKSRGSSLALPAITNSVKWSVQDTLWDLRSRTYLWIQELSQKTYPWKSLLVRETSQRSSLLMGKCFPVLYMLPHSLSETCERGTLFQESDICSSQEELEELAFLKYHRLSSVCLGETTKSEKFPYVAGLWKRCLTRTSPNAWVDITLRKYIFRVIQMWAGQIMEFFLLLLHANPIFSYFLSPEYFNLFLCLKKNIQQKSILTTCILFLPWMTWLL